MAKTAAWTVMVYLAGDNNLTTERMFALTEMKQAAVGNHLNVIAQFDPTICNNCDLQAKATPHP